MPATDSTPATTDGPAFRDLPSMLREHAMARPQAPCLHDAEGRVGWGEFDALLDRVAASLQRDGLRPRDSIAICASASIDYLSLFFGALRAGVAVAPLAPSSTPQQLADMVADAGARLFFRDSATAQALAMAGTALPAGTRAVHLGRDGAAGTPTLTDWLLPAGSRPQPVTIEPGWAFNLIYSSGTTGTPKGIVQSHGMRWAHIQRAALAGYGPAAVTLIATPLYSNTTLVSVIPSLAHGGQVVLMPKFDAQRYLQLAQARRTHARQLAEDVAKRLKAGDLARADGHQAEAALAAADAALAEAQAAAARVARQWQALTGLAPLQGDAFLPEGDPGSAAEPGPAHPALQELSTRAQATRRQRELAGAQSYAHPELTVGAMRERGTFGDAYGQRLVVGVRIPIGASSGSQARLAGASAEQIEAETTLALDSQRLAAEADAAREQVAALQAAAEAAERRARLAAESRGFFEKSFHLGQTDLPTRLRIDLEAFEAERQAARARIDLSAARSALRQALGLLPG